MIKALTGRPVGRPREFDEEQVLISAMEAFWRKGYEATSLTDLTECTCMNKASLYRVFGDKHQLFKAALKHYSEMEFREVVGVIRETASPLENIRAVIQKITTDFAHEKGCMMTNSMVELAPHDPEVRQMLQDFGEKRIQALTGMIDRAQHAGEVRSELVPMELAVSLMIALAGSATMVKGFMEDKQIIKNLENLIDSWT
ncbi:MAG: TetR/AcrR family transcriptional regulator [Gammaproteobacteria bacterium]|nr:TetR/AcrR family transcriptional regulator [Gammaproteobacteria bacterium]MCP4982124.1 TetR/AcrR family transcriptional regulator [Gammaproteobacteria bacterium]